MKTKSPVLTACLDANVIVSAIAFGGKPLKALQLALTRQFLHVTGMNILNETRRNLIGKLGLEKGRVDQFLSELSEVSSIFVPQGKSKYIEYEPDNLVLEVALVGGCDVLVTGDRTHLLPLSPFHGLIIEPPSKFLARLGAIKSV